MRCSSVGDDWAKYVSVLFEPDLKRIAYEIRETLTMKGPPKGGSTIAKTRGLSDDSFHFGPFPNLPSRIAHKERISAECEV